MRFQTKVLAGVPEEVSLELSGERVRSDDPLIRHKTTRREKYDAAQAAAEERGLWDGILLNEKGEITETGRANIIALVDDGLITPPVECGLLPGIIRKVLLDGGLVKEGLLRPEDLARSRALFVTNSLIRIAAVSSLKGTSYEPCRAFLGKTRDRLLEVLLRNSLGAKIICFPSPVET